MNSQSTPTVEQRGNVTANGFSVERREFFSRGVRCVGDFYRPHGVDNPPVVLMAHGFAAERAFRLPAYAERFANAGIAAFVFDYRTFGDSNGQPRHLVSFRRQRQDWQAALEFVRTLDDINSNRVALWGSSYSGGHVIYTAARMSGISAIISQVPAVDVPKSVRKVGLRFTAMAALHAGWDILRSLVFLSPHYVPVYGPPEQFAVLNRPGCEAGYRRMIPDESRWENRCAARELLFSLRNRPIRFAPQVPCPALVIAAERDQLVSARLARKAANLMPRGKYLELPCDHFGLYESEHFEFAIQREIAFLQRHLLETVEDAA